MFPVLVDFGSFELGGRTYPLVVGSYGVFAALSVLSAWLWTRYLGRQVRPDVNWTDLYWFTLFAAVAGGKLINVMVVVPEIARGEMTLFGAIIAGGTFLGILAAIPALFLMSRWFGVRTGLAANVIFTAVPFAHAVGRVGCFLGGCCYGAACDLPWAVTFTNPTTNAFNHTPLGVSLHPTQLYEVGVESFNFAVCLWLFRRRVGEWWIVVTWMGLYGIQRFVIEFFRDDLRGGYGPFSTSQWIGLGMAFLAIAGAVLLRRVAARAGSGR